ncbi:MAG TPA: SIMPL domain-containing protein [Accumulibacter sp.]|nr:SIMPL domain-containing protein [Accumulibacter sp.]HQC81496.1 SIMPL domain-containing protein [Accumulibacter sp.]
MPSLRPLLKTAPLLLSLLATSVMAAAGNSAATTIDLLAEASRPAANDLARATVFAEASGASPGELAKRVNRLIADGLSTAKAYGNIKSQSASTRTYPTQGKSGKIEGWRMRSDLTLESADTSALSELLGKLQNSLGVADLSMSPAPETQKKAENEAILDAIAAFKARAAVIANALGKSYRIKQLSITSGGGRPPAMPMMRASAAMIADAAPMPIDAGETVINANVSGQIELLE